MMRVGVWIAPLLVALSGVTSAARAQDREGLMGDLLRDVADVQSKIVGLAKAMPASAYEWRPGQGVRSTAEVLKHVISDNYLLPAVMGMQPPADTGITKDFKTALAYEKRSMTRDQIVAELEKSFGFVSNSMRGMSDAQVNAALDAFGRKTTNRGMWISTLTHLHEHLGQLIAYARSNNVTPPWSK